MALTGCRRNHPERLKRNQNPSCWVQSKRVGGGASEQPCWFQEVGRWRRWGRAVGLEVQVYLLPPAGRSQDKGHSRGREMKLISEDLQTSSSHLSPAITSSSRSSHWSIDLVLQSQWPEARGQLSLRRSIPDQLIDRHLIWSICSHWQAAVEQPIKMHRTSRHHRRQPIRSRHENPKKWKCCTRVWTCDLCTSSWRRRGGALGPRRRLCQDHRRYRKIKKLEYFLRLKP